MALGLRVLIILAFMVLGLVMAGSASAEQTCTVTGKGLHSHSYLDSDADICREGDPEPKNGAAVWADVGSNSVAMGSQYFAGNGRTNSEYLDCLEGACLVEYEGPEYGYYALCDNDCAVGYDFNDEFGNLLTLKMSYSRSGLSVVSTLSGASGPVSDDEVRAFVPAMLSPKNGSFSLNYTFSQAVLPTEGTELGLIVDGGIITGRSGGDTDWSVTITPDGEGRLSVTLPQEAVVGISGAPLDRDYVTTVLIDQTAPVIELVSPEVHGSSKLILYVDVDDDTAVFDMSKLDVILSGAANSAEFDTSNEAIVISANEFGEATIQLAAGILKDAAGNESSASNVITHTFGIPVDVTSLTATHPSETTSNDPIIFNVTYLPADAEGAVTIFYNGQFLSEGWGRNGTVSLTTTLPAGGHEIRAEFTPDEWSNYTTGASKTYSIEIAGAPMTVTWAGHPGQVPMGASISLMAEMSNEHFAGSIIVERALDNMSFEALDAQVDRNAEKLIVRIPSEGAGKYRYRLRLVDEVTQAESVSDINFIEVLDLDISSMFTTDKLAYKVGEVPVLRIQNAPEQWNGAIMFASDNGFKEWADLSGGTATVYGTPFDQEGEVEFSAYLVEGEFMLDFDPVRVAVEEGVVRGSIAFDKDIYYPNDAAKITVAMTPADTSGKIEFLINEEVVGQSVIEGGLAEFTTEQFSNTGYYLVLARYLNEATGESANIGGALILVDQRQVEGRLSLDKAEYLVGEVPRIAVHFFDASVEGTVEISINDDLFATVPIINGLAEIEGPAFDLIGDYSFSARVIGNGSYPDFDTNGRVVSVVETIAPTGTVSLDRSAYAVGEAAEISVLMDDTSSTGDVEISMNGEVVGIPSLTNGAASIMAPIFDEARTYHFAARYLGDENHVAVDLTDVFVDVAKGAVGASILSDRSIYQVGDQALISVTMGEASATGTVSVHLDGVTVGSGALVEGSVSIATKAFDAAGSVVMTVEYSGNASFEAADLGEISVSVERMPAAGALSLDQNTYRIGDTPSISVQMTSADVTGQVDLTVNGQLLGTFSLKGGVIEVSGMPFEAAGTVVIEAVYLGDAKYEGSLVGTVTVDVLSKNIQGEVRLDRASYSVSDAPVATAILSDETATGLVTFFIDGFEAGSAPASAGRATLALDAISQRQDVILTAFYSGDATFAEAELISATIVVLETSISGELTTGSAEYSAGDEPTITAVLDAIDASGEVEFYRNGLSLGRQVATDGVVEYFGPAFEAAGEYVFSAIYLGDATYPSFEFTGVTVNVSKKMLGGRLYLDAERYAVGDQASMIATVGERIAKGDVEFYMDGVLIGFAPVVDGEAAMTGPVFDTEGSVTVHARYLGDAAFEAVDLDAIIVEVAAASAHGTLFTDGRSYRVGDEAIATVSFDAPGVSGSVEFFIDATSAGVVDVVDGSATFRAPPFASEGAVTFTARYLGNEQFDPMDIDGVTIIVTSTGAIAQIELDSSQYTIGGQAEASVYFLDDTTEGNVEFLLDGELYGTAQIEFGVAALSTPILTAAGQHMIAARYLGDAGQESVEIDGASFEVIKRKVAATFSADRWTYAVGEAAELSIYFDDVSVSGRVEISRDAEQLGSVEVSNGEALFTTPAFAADGEYAFSAKYLGDEVFEELTLEPIVLSVAKLGTAGVLSLDRASFLVGEAAQIVVAFDKDTTTGAVEFAINGEIIGESVVANGLATFTSPAFAGAGDYHFSARYLGDESHEAADIDGITISVALREVAAHLTLDRTSYALGDVASLTVAFDDLGAEGEVTFIMDDVVIGVSEITNGRASFASQPFDVSGEPRFVARYLGNATYSPAVTSEVWVTVHGQETAAYLSLSQRNFSVGDAVDALVSFGDTGITGDVEFSIDGQVVGTSAVSNGSATLRTFEFEAAGEYMIAARYLGSDTHDALDIEGVLVTVERAVITGTLISDQDTYRPGDRPTVQANMADERATGFIEFMLDGLGVGSVDLVGGVAYLTDLPLGGEGSYRLTGRYSGDARFAEAELDEIVLRVERIQASGVLTLDRAEYARDEQAQVSVLMSDPLMTGLVDVFLDDDWIGEIDVIDGTGSLSAPAFTRTGYISFSARYLGNESYAPIDLAAVSAEVSTADTSLALFSDRGEYRPGEVAILTAIVSSPTATGSVEFFMDGQSVGVTDVAAGATEISVVTPADLGEHAIEARYSGDDQHGPSNSQTITILIAKANVALTVEFDREVYRTGEAARLAVRVYPESAAGLIDVYMNGVVMVYDSLIDGEVVLTLPAFTQAEDAILTISYEGDEAHAAGSLDAFVRIFKPEGELVLTLDRSAYAIGDVAVAQVVAADGDLEGRVDIYQDGGLVAGGDMTNGEVFVSLPAFETTGTKSFVARYAGASLEDSLESSTLEGVEVSKRATQIYLSSDADTYLPGEAAILVAEVAPGTAMGRVDFLQDSQVIGSAMISGGRAQFEVPTYAGQGMYHYSAEYAGDATHLPSETASGVSIRVGDIETMIWIHPDRGSYYFGDRALIEAQLSPQSATGDVEFYVAGELVSVSQATDGIARYLSDPLTEDAEYAITARYLGDMRHASSETADVLIIRPQAKEVSITIDVGGGSYEVGDEAIYSAFVDPTDTAGEVVFTVDGSEIGRTSLSSGEASLVAPAFGEAGVFEVVVRFVAADGSETGISARDYVTVDRKASGISLTLVAPADGSPIAAGDTAVLRASVDPAISSGNAIFYVDGVEFARRSLSESLDVSYEFPAAGVYSFIAALESVPGVEGDLSGELLVNVDLIATTVSLHYVAPAADGSDAGLLLAEVTPAVDGVMVFKDHGEEIASVDVVSGKGEASFVRSGAAHRLQAEFVPIEGAKYAKGMSHALDIEADAIEVFVEVNLTAIAAAPGEAFRISGSLSEPGLDGDVNLYRSQGGGNFVFVEQARTEAGSFSFTRGEYEVGYYEYQVRLTPMPGYLAQPSPVVEATIALHSGVGLLELSTTSVALGESVDVRLVFERGDVEGFVDFYLDDQLHSTSAVLESGGQSAASTSMEMGVAGTRSIKAQYRGSVTHEAFETAAQTIDVTKRSIDLTISSDQMRYVPGTQAAIVAAISDTAATGTVTFFVDGAMFAVVAVTDGKAVTDLEMAEGEVAVHAEYSGDDLHSEAISDVINLSAGKLLAHGSLGGSSSIARIEDVVTLDYRLSPASATGVVVFWQDDIETGRATLLNGQASITVSQAEAGVVDFTAQYLGDELHEVSDVSAPFQILFEKLPATVQITTNGDTFAMGDSIDLMVDVDPAEATGPVELFMGDVLLEAALAEDGRLFATIDLAEEGAISFRVQYSGSERFAAAEAEFEVLVENPASGIVLVLDGLPGSVEIGDRVEITGQVYGVSANSVVTLEIDAGLGYEELGQVIASAGNFTFDWLASQAGEYRIRARMDATASDVEYIDVLLKSSYLELTSDKAAYAVGEMGHFGVVHADGAAQGEVAFLINGEIIGRADLDGGVSLLSHEFIEEGILTLSAQYEGDGIFEASTSEEIEIEVGRTAVALGLTVDATSYRPGDEIELSVDVSPAFSGAEIEFLRDGVVIGTATTEAGVARLRVAAASEGSVLFSARFSGDARYLSAISNEVLVQIKKADVALRIERLSPTITPGSQVAFELVVSPAIAGERIEILTSTGLSMWINMTSETRYAFSLMAPISGEMSIWAAFAGNEGINPTRSSDLVVTSVSSTSTISLMVGSATPAEGEAVTLVAQVAPQDASGTVVFFVDGDEVARSDLAQGRATASWTAASGIHTIHARYLGDGRYDASQSAAVRIFGGPSAAEMFETRSDEVVRIMGSEARRAATARSGQTDRIIERVRDRFRAEAVRKGPVREGWIDGEWEPFRWEGDFTALDGSSRGRANFMAGGRTSDGGVSRYIDGSVSMSSEDGYGSGVQMNLAGVLEFQPSKDAVLGLKAGVETGKTTISATQGLGGEMNTSGANIGAYAVRKLEGSVVIDGFVDAAKLSHDLSLSDDQMDATASYGSTQLQAGGTISGRYDSGRRSFIPSASIRHTITTRDQADFDVVSGNGDAGQSSMDAGQDALTRAEVSPQLEFRGERGSKTQRTLSPTAVCEWEEAGSNCGFGFGAGLTSSFADGRGTFSLGGEAEWIGDRATRGLYLGLDLRF